MYHPETLSYDCKLKLASVAFPSILGQPQHCLHNSHYLFGHWILARIFDLSTVFFHFPHTISRGKDFSTIAKYGALLTLAGELTRFIGECTLKQNFTHIIRVQKASNQQLIKTGIYKYRLVFHDRMCSRYLRHPAYTGWFYFVIGTQIVLGNFVCFILYCFAAWYFFADRIPYPLLLSLILSFHHSCTYEEDLLEQFFPGEYEEYKKTTHIFIPYIYALTNKYFLLSEVIALRNM